MNFSACSFVSKAPAIFSFFRQSCCDPNPGAISSFVPLRFPAPKSVAVCCCFSTFSWPFGLFWPLPATGVLSVSAFFGEHALTARAALEAVSREDGPFVHERPDWQRVRDSNPCTGLERTERDFEMDVFIHEEIRVFCKRAKQTERLERELRTQLEARIGEEQGKTSRRGPGRGLGKPTGSRSLGCRNARSLHGRASIGFLEADREGKRYQPCFREAFS